MAEEIPPFSTGDLASAERLAALELTPEERAQALPNVERFAQSYLARRSTDLPNSLPLALGFDPRPAPVGGVVPQVFVIESGREPGPLPDDEAEIAFAPLTRLSGWLAEGAISSERLTRLYLDRLRRYDPKLECVVTLTEDLALEQAARADRELGAGGRRGPLHGVPWGAKDLLDTAGIATTWGATPYRDRVPGTDAAVVTRLRTAGAVLAAKLSLGELAMDDVWFGGKTKNPWKLDQGASGSSAGSAAAMAAGLLGFGIGSETLGSITSPSARCGAVGLRPTFGRVPRSGAMALSWSFDKLGPICRSVEDCALVLAAIIGPDGHDFDATDEPFAFDALRDARGLRVGYVPPMFEDKLPGPFEEDDPPVHATERAALGLLRDAGMTLVEIPAPDLPIDPVFSLILVDVAAQFEELTLSGRDDQLARQDDAAWPNSLRSARYVPAVEYVQMQRLRRLMMRAMGELFEQVDVIVAPGIGKAFLAWTNASGHPALTIPAGFRADGTPTAITLHGRLYDEGRLCNAGMAFEQARGPWDGKPRLEG